jgi:hypothetical protein
MLVSVAVLPADPCIEPDSELLEPVSLRPPPQAAISAAAAQPRISDVILMWVASGVSPICTLPPSPTTREKPSFSVQASS